MASTAFHAIAAGKSFSDAKEKHLAEFGGTGWREAVESRGLALSTVDRFIDVFEVFGNSGNVAEISPSSLLRLAAPTVPQAAREQAIELASQGEKLTVRETEELIRKAKAEHVCYTLIF